MLLSAPAAAVETDNLFGPISAAHSKSLQQFDVVRQRRDWQRIFRSKPTDHVLQVAWHKARAKCRCVDASSRHQSQRWLERRGLSNARFDVDKGTMWVP